MKQNLISKWSGEYVKEAENQRRLSAAQDRMDRWSSSSDTIPSSATSESALDSGYHIQSSSGYTGAAAGEQSVWNGEPPFGGGPDEEVCATMHETDFQESRIAMRLNAFGVLLINKFLSWVDGG